MSALAPPRAAIFDMDGLMLDTERIAIGCWLDAATELALTFPESAALGMVGMHISKAPAYLTDLFGSDFPTEALLAATHTRYMAATTRPIPLKADLLSLLGWLEDAELPKAVATSTRRSIAEHHLDAVGILTRFRLLVCGDEIAQPKPDPEIYIKAAGLLGAKPQHCVVFEDSNFGVAAAHAAGCRVIMVPDLKPPTAETLALGVPVVRSLGEARTLAASWLE
ncbi:HAD family hydrolase [Chitinolyticbacter meiyuanensis]|uniref:HAD family hydrolase n=1 Tax=Chitinolyticbacter meiyuanensis TaxID=682798 RepID=UPI0011E5D86A|nr:HAD family phosphatase [Chitinolyticbacter meiyuanensis]